MAPNEWCWVEDCKRPATERPAIRFWSTLTRSHAPGVAEFVNMRVCSECRDKMVLENFLSAGGKAMIENLLSEAGKAVPCWSNAELVWNPGQDA